MYMHIEINRERSVRSILRREHISSSLCLAGITHGGLFQYDNQAPQCATLTRFTPMLCMVIHLFHATLTFSHRNDQLFFYLNFSLFILNTPYIEDRFC